MNESEGVSIRLFCSASIHVVTYCHDERLLLLCLNVTFSFPVVTLFHKFYKRSPIRVQAAMVRYAYEKILVHFSLMERSIYEKKLVWEL